MSSNSNNNSNSKSMSKSNSNSRYNELKGISLTSSTETDFYDLVPGAGGAGVGVGVGVGVDGPGGNEFVGNGKRSTMKGMDSSSNNYSNYVIEPDEDEDENENANANADESERGKGEYDDGGDDDMMGLRQSSTYRIAQEAKKAIELESDAAFSNSERNGKSDDSSNTNVNAMENAVVNRRVQAKENSYVRAHREKMTLSPKRGDMFSDENDATTTYKEIMRARQLEQEQQSLDSQIPAASGKRKNHEIESQDGKALNELSSSGSGTQSGSGGGEKRKRRRRRWDDAGSGTSSSESSTSSSVPSAALLHHSDAESESAASTSNSIPNSNSSKGMFSSSTTASSSREMPTPRMRRSRWDETPVDDSRSKDTTTKSSSNGTVGKRSRWDVTPAHVGSGSSASASASATPLNIAASYASSGAETPQVLSGADATPLTWQLKSSAAGATATDTTTTTTPGDGKDGATPYIPQTAEEARQLRLEREIAEKNRPLSKEELDAMLPSEGYTILDPPADYKPNRTASRQLLSTPTPFASSSSSSSSGTTQEGFYMSATPSREEYGVPLITTVEGEGDLPGIRPEDLQYFGKLVSKNDSEEGQGGEHALSKEEVKERAIMRLLLKIKNGTPPQRKQAMRQITDKARDFGAGPLFDQVLPLLMSPTLEEQERHLLVKVVDRILYKLDDLVRPYTHKILAVIEPMLIDEDYFARVEAREVLSNVAKAAGLVTMIQTMRPDIDSADEFVRNTTARAFAVVASALSVPALLPFLKAVCQSRKSWQARHTGAKIVQQIAILLGCAILPHLNQLVDIVQHGLVDDQQKVRTMTALAVSALAEAAHPYGIESFDPVLPPLWKGIRQHRGKGLAAFLKAIGYIIPLMEQDHANHYTRDVMPILIREFKTPDEEMKKIVLKVVKQCISADGVPADYVREEVLPDFFRSFWVRRMALDNRNYKQLVETTVEIANKVGGADIIQRIVVDLKDDSEPYRRMVMETIDKVIQNLGAADVGARLEQLLMDGVLFAFQEQSLGAQDNSGELDGNLLNQKSKNNAHKAMLNGFSTVVNALGVRASPYLPQVAGRVKWRLHHKSPEVRMQAADLIARIAPVMRECDAEELMGHMGLVLYENLGEEFPEVLGSILGALKAIVSVIGMNKMTPPISDLLPSLTPILKNRHEKVQENAIDLVGRIADRGAEYVSAKEWMRICFELLEMLKAGKKAIRRAAVSTFGYVAKAVGPSDVLHTLLKNLKVQERQLRVCTTVAIAIVAETCSPFTVLPALMYEYKTPELNVQNGVLKALSFLCEYIGELSRDYIYAIVPLLEDALTDRDIVHRQTACACVKHLALGVQGLGCEDALVHLLNLVWPNIFETSPHMIQAVFEAIEGLRVSLGPQLILMYTLQGLYHPAQRIRDVYWRIYNNLYVYGFDGMLPAYPRLEDDIEVPIQKIAKDENALKQIEPSFVELKAPPSILPPEKVLASQKLKDAEIPGAKQPGIARSYQSTYFDLFI